jgi:methionine-rich copper-binding protein CopC
MERPRLPKWPRATSTMKKIISFFLAGLFVIGCAPSASAHAQLTSSNPGVNKTIKSIGEFVWVEFDGDLMVFGDKNPNVITVTDAKKKRVDAGGSLVGGARLSTRIKPGLKSGKYLVSYRVVSEDGHPVQGSFFFNYKP